MAITVSSLLHNEYCNQHHALLALNEVGMENDSTLWPLIAAVYLNNACCRHFVGNFDNVRLVLRTTDSLECSFMDRLSPKTLHPHTLC